MSIGLEIKSQMQLRAIVNGATIVMFPIDDERIVDLPIQNGDKDIFIKEEFATREIYDNTIKYKADDKKSKKQLCNWQPACKMTKEQSRFKDWECLDDRAVRVQDMKISDWQKIFNLPKFISVSALEKQSIEYCNNQMQEQNINRTYEDNDYVFLLEFRR